ncbi:hypothetical protein [Pontibacter arcticus]|uniref:Uncharacterized protein n=1 Tax=Pontibacter arcticus TaxID=2080288 RepID=A0A364RJ40_9BACT|nr:hypothetical protein [Pontibacter arcticus]RAU84319.1 hypothetical protein DP923_04570 [Pontibacter arcticus]
MKKTLYFILCCLLLSYTSFAQSQQTGRYYIQLHNGQVIYADKLQYKSPVFRSNHFLLNDSLKYNPGAVVAFQDDEGYFARVEAGNSYESFAKRLLDGPRIDRFYTSRATYDYSGYGYGPYGYGGPRTSRRRIYFFSKDDGPLYVLNYENLQEALADNAASMDLLGKYRKDKYINTGVSIVGAGLLAAGAITSFSSQGSGTNISPLMYAGAGILGVQMVINLFQKDKLTQAMEVYNYQIQQ